jgi:hypothetical protein
VLHYDREKGVTNMKNKQKHMTEYLTGYVRPDGMFIRNMWGEKARSVEDAVKQAIRYTADGNEVLEGMGVEAQFRPAIVTREVWYEESEPEVVA